MARLFISCGESSGEAYAAALVAELRRRIGQLEVIGLGGDRLAGENVRLLAHLRDLAVVGLFEVLSHLPRLKRLFDRIVREVDVFQPQVAVLIDYPDFNLRLAREFKKRGIRVVYYVSPQLWAWRSHRIHQVKRDVAKMLVLFPFEEDVYKDAGVPVRFVGHPLVSEVQPPADRKALARELGLDPSRPLIALLPGSRSKEAAFNLPPLVGAALLLRAARPDLQYVLAAAPHVSDESLASARQAGVAILRERVRDVLGAARLALVASGTATVETALTGTPMIVVYRLSPLTYFFGKPFVRVKNYAMVNLIAGREVVPELIQKNFTPENVARESLALLDDSPTRDAMLRDLAEVRTKLGAPGATSRAADEVMPYLT